MRRFILLLLLLCATLLIASRINAEPIPDAERHRIRIGGDWDWDHDDDERDWRRREGRHHPRVRRGEIVFRISDRGYHQVYVAGDFNDWQEEPMSYVEARELWELSIDFDRRRTRYVYVVEDEDGTTRRTDPANPKRARYDGRWVSEIVVGKDHRVLRPYDSYDFDWSDDGHIDFNRVEGLVLGIRPRMSSRSLWSPRIDARLDYGFSSDRWNAGFELAQPLTPEGSLELTLGGHDETTYTERTGAGDVENMLTTWTFREDHRDYYRREGIALGLRWQPMRDVDLRAQLRSEDHSAMEVATSAGWNLGRRSFRPNPAAEEGTLRSLWLRGQWGDDLHHLRVEFERSDDRMLSSEFDFSRFEAQLRTRVRLGYWQYLDLRLGFGAAVDGHLPTQKQFAVGGFGTVRGYRYQSLLMLDPARSPLDPVPFGAQKMTIFNAEYAIAVEDDLSLMLLFDSGMAWEDEDADIDPEDFSSSIGVGIKLDDDDDGGLRFDLVKSLEGNGDSFLLQARLERPF